MVSNLCFFLPKSILFFTNLQEKIRKSFSFSFFFLFCFFSFVFFFCFVVFVESPSGALCEGVSVKGVLGSVTMVEGFGFWESKSSGLWVFLRGSIVESKPVPVF